MQFILLMMLTRRKHGLKFFSIEDIKYAARQRN